MGLMEPVPAYIEQIYHKITRGSGGWPRFCADMEHEGSGGRPGDCTEMEYGGSSRQPGAMQEDRNFWADGWRGPSRRLPARTEPLWRLVKQRGETQASGSAAGDIESDRWARLTGGCCCCSTRTGDGCENNKTKLQNTIGKQKVHNQKVSNQNPQTLHFRAQSHDSILPKGTSECTLEGDEDQTTNLLVSGWTSQTFYFFMCISSTSTWLAILAFAPLSHCDGNSSWDLKYEIHQTGVAFESFY